jgi:hypothetical protein
LEVLQISGSRFIVSELSPSRFCHWDVHRGAFALGTVIPPETRRDPPPQFISGDLGSVIFGFFYRQDSKNKLSGINGFSLRISLAAINDRLSSDINQIIIEISMII